MSRWASYSGPPTVSRGSGGSSETRPAAMRDYFDDDDDDNGPAVSAGRPLQQSGADDADDYDPLDQFMADVGSEVQQQQADAAAGVAGGGLPEIVSGQERDYEAFYDLVDKQSKADAAAAEVEYDSDGVPVGLRGAEEKKLIDPLPPVDHSKIAYPAFRKDLYHEHPVVQALSEQEAAAVRELLDIHVSGAAVPKPVQGFNQAGFNAQLLREVGRQGYESPTAIQAQALPVAMSGRDIIGLAKTGSGKTLSFVWPMIVHVLDQPQMQLGDGPIGLILAPTRELATQIYSEANKFCKVFNIRVCAVYGGEGKWEQSRALKESPEIVVATPGRFIDFASAKATNLRRCTMVVLDEADRMFEMGFEYQMRSIVNNIRPDRQTLLFSATMKKKIEGFAREILRDPVRIVIGNIGASNKDIRQVVDVVGSAAGKWPWLTARIDDWIAEGKVLVFVGSKADTEALAGSLKTFFQQRQLAVGLDCLHGDKTQADRSSILRKFRGGEVTVLVATDVASRGLDIKDIRTVVNYDCAKSIETHVHRIGRTGRMGVDGVTPGTAFTVLVSERAPSADSSLAVDLVRNLREAGQGDQVSPQLLRLAEADPRSAALRSKPGGGGIGPWAAGGRGGIGSSGAAVAMTSAMLAAAPTPTLTLSAATAPRSAPSPKDFEANKYIPGHSLGRGRHLTQPAWMGDSDAPPGGSSDAPTLPVPAPGELSRFEDAPRAATATPPAAPALPGFVRAAASLSSVSVSGAAPPPAPPAGPGLGLGPAATGPAASEQPKKKRSRWDT